MNEWLKNDKPLANQHGDGAYDLEAMPETFAVDPHEPTIRWRVWDGKLCYKRTEKDWLWCEYPATLGGWLVPSATLERCRVWVELFVSRASV